MIFFIFLFYSSAADAVEATINKLGDFFICSSSTGGAACYTSQSSNAGVNLAITVFAGLVIGAAMYSTARGHLKSPWPRRKRKHALTLQQWRSLFTPDGKLRDGVKFLNKVRNGGVDPSIRSEVWPFLLGVYDLNSCKEERDKLTILGRKKYEKLRRNCKKLLRSNTGESNSNEEMESEDVGSAMDSISSEEISSVVLEEDATGESFMLPNISDSGSSLDSSESSEDDDDDAEISQTYPSSDNNNKSRDGGEPEVQSKHLLHRSTEDFSTWQRIIRLDAIRANADWIPYSLTEAEISEERALRSAQDMGLKDYKHLEPCRVFHAARLVAILEAYAVYDPEIGYCQGMSDLLSPIITVMTENHQAFWCFVGFMKRARHNFRLDETGIRRQLSRVSKIIKSKDSHLFKHLEKLQAEDCFFVYRMVVVLFRRELTFEQTICLWEVMWADQAAIRAGINKSAWNRIRLRAPPTEDLLLYAIAASVLQRRKKIIEKYSSMDEIIRECNSMAGQLDVWKLLDDAHDLVASVQNKIETE